MHKASMNKYAFKNVVKHYAPYSVFVTDVVYNWIS